MLMLWFAALLAATLSTGIPTAVTCETRVFGDATVGCIPGLDEDQLAVAYATVNPSFHPKGVWSLSITLQRHRSARRVHDFINILDSIARSRCHVTTAYYNAEFCADVNVARNVTNAAYDALFPDEDLGIVTPSNSSVFIPEYVSFHEVRVNELWSQLHDGAGQPVFVDRVVLQKLSELIRAKVARLKQLADDDANMWTKLLVYSTAPSSSALACPVLEDAYAHAASMLPPGVTFNGPLSCSALPPLGIRRSVREVILTMYLDVGVVCSDTLAFPVPIIFNETHLLTLAVPDGAVLSCAGEPPERTASLCAEGLYRDGVDFRSVCHIESLRGDRPFILHGRRQIFVVSKRPVPVVFKSKSNGTLMSQSTNLQGRKLITYSGDTVVLLKGLSPDPHSTVKLVGYVYRDPPAETVVSSAEVDVTGYVFLFIFLLCIFIPGAIFAYFLYFAKKVMGAAMNL